MFSRKVFCGATKPLRPPGILSAHCLLNIHRDLSIDSTSISRLAPNVSQCLGDSPTAQLTDSQSIIINIVGALALPDNEYYSGSTLRLAQYGASVANSRRYCCGFFFQLFIRSALVHFHQVTLRTIELSVRAYIDVHVSQDLRIDDDGECTGFVVEECKWGLRNVGSSSLFFYFLPLSLERFFHCHYGLNGY